MVFRGVVLAGLMASGVVLSACDKKTASLDADPIATATASTETPSMKQIQTLSDAWKKDKTNPTTAIAYATSVEKLGQRETQLEVLRTSASQTRGDAVAQSKLGRALLAAGDMPASTETLTRATELNPQDASTLSALGAALDQQTKHAEAREKYQAALALDPGNINTMNNLGMSYSLQGKLPEAEQTLRAALATPKGKNMPRVRQNLALVVGLQGRFDEAKKIASEDLPPDQVQANMDYLQKMLAKQNTWDQLKEPSGG
jgi:Flp pilus assembly protein TadD